MSITEIRDKSIIHRRYEAGGQVVPKTDSAGRFYGALFAEWNCNAIRHRVESLRTQFDTLCRISNEEAGRLGRRSHKRSR